MQINRCPKCGRMPEVIRTVRFTLIDYEVKCHDCRLYIERCDTPKQAIAKWNEMTKGENK
jgi:transcription elongation factor Elf1